MSSSSSDESDPENPTPFEIIRNNRIVWPPKKVYQMKTLDRELFKTVINAPFVVVKTDQIAQVTKVLRPYFFKMSRFKPVQVATDLSPDHHRIYLHPDWFTHETEKAIAQVSSSLVPVFEFNNEPKYLGFQEMELNYDNFDHHTVFRAIFPPEVETISSFSTIGHIIHLNLRDAALPWKNLIGQVLLDKIAGCRMVINKLNIIDNTFRNFAMEVLAKDDKEPVPDTIVTTTESEIRYKFDFAKVYWNPRLSAERERINKKLNHGVDVLYDVFAGVGPFALTASKFRKCRVLANDLNPESYRWLCENVKINKVDKLVTCYNLDGREFIRQKLKNDLIECAKNYDGTDANRRYHVVMNLPEIAVEFLDAFDGLLAEIRDDPTISHKIPQLDIHCYCFVKNIPEEEVANYVIGLASEKLGHKLTEEVVDEVFDVRKVAPNKNMYRISFRLSQEILYGSVAKATTTEQSGGDGDDEEQSVATKRLKTE